MIKQFSKNENLEGCMMTGSHKIVGIIIFIIVLTTTVIGCGNDDNNNTTIHTQTPAVSATQTLDFTPSPTASPELTPSADADTIVERASVYLKNETEYSVKRWISSVRWKASDRSDAYGRDIYSEMKFDLTDHNLEMENVANIKIDYDAASSSVIDNNIYIIDDMLYVRGYYPDSPMQWVKMSITEDYWMLNNQAGIIMELVEISGTEVLKPEVIKIENDSIYCDVLQVMPEPEKFWEMIAQQPWVELPLEPPDGFSYDQIITNAKMKLWLSQTEFLPVQAELSLSIEVGTEMVPAITDSVSMEVEVIMQFDYNRQINIELPQDAMVASDLDLQQSQ